MSSIAVSSYALRASSSVSRGRLALIGVATALAAIVWMPTTLTRSPAR